MRGIRHARVQVLTTDRFFAMLATTHTPQYRPPCSFSGPPRRLWGALHGMRSVITTTVELAYFRAGLGAALTAADPAGLTPPTGVAAGLAGCLAGPLEGLAAALTGTAGALPPTGAAAGLALTGAAGAFAGCVAAPATGVNAGESCETSAEGAFAAAGASGSLGRPGGALAAREAAGAPRCCCCRGGARRWRDEQRKE